MIKLSSTHFFAHIWLARSVGKSIIVRLWRYIFQLLIHFWDMLNCCFWHIWKKRKVCLLTCCLSFCSDMWKDNIRIEKSSTKQTFWDSLGTFGMLWSISWTVGKSRKYRDDDSRCRWQVCNLHRIPNTILKRRAREVFVNVDIMEMISTTTTRRDYHYSSSLVHSDNDVSSSGFRLHKSCKPPMNNLRAILMGSKRQIVF